MKTFNLNIKNGNKEAKKKVLAVVGLNKRLKVNISVYGCMVGFISEANVYCINSKKNNWRYRLTLLEHMRFNRTLKP